MGRTDRVFAVSAVFLVYKNCILSSAQLVRFHSVFSLMNWFAATFFVLRFRMWLRYSNFFYCFYPRFRLFLSDRTLHTFARIFYLCYTTFWTFFPVFEVESANFHNLQHIIHTFSMSFNTQGGQSSDKRNDMLICKSTFPFHHSDFDGCLWKIAHPQGPESIRTFQRENRPTTQCWRSNPLRAFWQTN